MIDLFSVMHNEEVLLPYWLRHYEPIADRIFIWDDASTDASRGILSWCPKVTFLPMERHGGDDVYWTEKLFPQYEQISRGKADWVIVADADEFIYHPRLLEVLARERRKGTQLIRCQGFAMVSDSPPTTSGQIYDEIKLGLPDKMETKWTIHSPDAYIRHGIGRHAMPLDHEGCVRSEDTGIKLLHYRYLGEAYHEARDRVLHERHRIVDHLDLPYSRDEVRTCPDRRHGPVLDWYARHKGEAVNVVDE